MSEIKRDDEYIDSINDPDLEPLEKAVTINLAEGIKIGIWKFESEGEARTVHATTESEDINGSGFDDLEQKGR